jgi:uncharacterized protein YndB with AHSA1/START domain
MIAREGDDAMTKNETKLELPSDRDIRIKRTIDAPARIVFECWTKPEFLRRWWAPKSRGVTLVGCDVDLKVGGAYRYVMRRDGGQEMAFSGKYSEVVPHSRLVYSNVFEPMRAMGEAVVTVTFDEDGVRTYVTTVERYPSKEVRDGVIATGMERGMRESMDQLEALAAELR